MKPETDANTQIKPEIQIQIQIYGVKQCIKSKKPRRGQIFWQPPRGPLDSRKYKSYLIAQFSNFLLDFFFTISQNMDGWMDVHFGSWALTLSKECSLASYPSTESTDNASGRVIPAKKPIHSCKYSTGVNLTVLVCQWCNCNCQFKEGTTNYSIQIV